MQGIYPALSAEEYHADPAPLPSLSNSLIKTVLSKSPKHAWCKHPRLNPNYQLASSDNDKFDLGTAAHALFLEKKEPVIVDADDWRTKEAKAIRDSARAAGQAVLLRYQYEKTMEMVSVLNDFVETTVLAGLMSPDAGTSETTAMWQDGSVWCRGLIDRLSSDKSLFVDYKTTSAPSPDAFIRQSMVAFGYDTQHQFYKQGLAMLGYRARGLFLVQEDTYPYACYLIEPSESMSELAERKVNRAVTIWSMCQSSGVWAGYGSSVRSAQAPMWAMREEYEHE